MIDADRRPQAQLIQMLVGLTAALLLPLASATAQPKPEAASKSSDQKLWQALSGGAAFAIMRHAIAPGNGDPANFQVGDCKTQRNLSERGREQARRSGRMMRANGISQAIIYTSQWCRCRETARLLDVGKPIDLPSLNSFYETYERRDSQTAALKSWLRKRGTSGPLILVTHQVNISALTGQGTASGEIVFVTADATGRYSVLGSIEP